MKKLLALEDMAVRVMYFFNVTDTFLPFSVALFVTLVQLGFLTPFGLAPFPGTLFGLAAVFLFTYLCCRIADLHVYFLLALVPVILVASWAGHFQIRAILATFVFLFLLTSLVQILFMGLPMSLASRSPAVALRMYLNSFVILAPTTISLPVTLGYQMIMVATLSGTAGERLFSTQVLTILITLLILALLTRRFRKKIFIPPTFHPTPTQAAYGRVILLNIDGLSHKALEEAEAPFLHHLSRQFAAAPKGAHTVYKAFTNPAFASILSGVEPEKHRVFNNNFGQSIKVEALPDIISTRLYGSMHVKHFSRPEWEVSIVSLVESSYDRADDALMEKLKKDLKRFKDVRLWIVDLSLADYCGHAWGGYSDKYTWAISRLDTLIKSFFKFCLTENLIEDTLFIISSDHGLFIGEHAYMLSQKEEFVPLIFVGSGIAPTRLPDQTSIMDIAANISYGLGGPYARQSRGRVFEGMHQIDRVDRGNGDRGDDFRSRLGLK